MSWITLQVCSMLLLSINSILDKRLMRDQVSSPVVQLASFAIVGLPVVVIGICILPWPGIKPVVLGLISGLIFSLVVVLYYRALSLDDVSRLVPILRLSGVFQLALLALFLGDRLTLFQYLAFTGMLIGSFGLSWKARQQFTYPQRDLRIGNGVFLMGLVAVLLAFQGVIDSHLNLEYSPWILIVWSNAGTILGFSLVMLSPKKRGQFIESIIAISPLFKGIIFGQQISRLIVGLLSDFAVNQAGSAALVSVVGSLQPVVVLVMAMLFLSERMDRREVLPKLIGICFLGLGAGFLF